MGNVKHSPQASVTTHQVNDRELGLGVRAQLMKALIKHGLTAAGMLARRVYQARGAFSNFEIIRDIGYGSEPAQRLEVWRDNRPRTALRPLVLFLHAGGFQHLDKETHWAFAERFAQAGAVVVNADYRLAPAHRYPAAVLDAELAYQWTLRHAEALGADPRQLVLAGASAGANLALGLAIRHSLQQQETSERAAAVVLFSGLLQVSDMPRLYRSRRVSRLLQARIASIGCDYPVTDLAAWSVPSEPDPRLDPLLYLEAQQTSLSGFPATFVSTGSADQVLEHSLRLSACLARHGQPYQLDMLQGAGHAFQGLLFKASVRTLWERCFAFLREQGVALQSTC